MKLMTAVKTKERTNVRKEHLTESKLGYLLILPNYLIYITFTLIPIIWTIVMSFTDYDLRNSHFVGVQNYIAIFKDQTFLRSIWNTVYYSLLTILPTIVLALLLALLLNRKIRGRGFFRTLFYLPNILSMVAVSMARSYLYNAQAGILNRMLNAVGLPSIGWVTDTRWAMISVAIMAIWQSLGYNAVLYLSGLQGIPDYLYEAATIDGANGVQQFFSITIPSLKPTTFFIFVMACIHSFEVFGQVYILTQGGPMNSTTTIAHQVYLNGFEYYKMGYASAEAVVLLVLIMIMTLINMKGGNTDVD